MPVPNAFPHHEVSLAEAQKRAASMNEAEAKIFITAFQEGRQWTYYKLTEKQPKTWNFHNKMYNLSDGRYQYIAHEIDSFESLNREKYPVILVFNHPPDNEGWGDKRIHVGFIHELTQDRVVLSNFLTRVPDTQHSLNEPRHELDKIYRILSIFEI